MRTFFVLLILFCLALTTSVGAQATCPAGSVPVTVCGPAAPANPPLPTPAPAPEPSPAPVPQPPSGSPVFFDDFETVTLDTRKWDGPDSTTAAARVGVFAGRRCLRVSQSNYGWGGELMGRLPAMDEVTLQFQWFVPSSAVLAEVGRAGSQHLWRLGGKDGVNSSVQLNFETVGAGVVQATSFWSSELNFGGILTPPRDRWFTVKVWYKLGTVGASDGAFGLYVDGRTIVEKTGLKLRSSAAKIESLRLVTNYDDATAYWLFDDVAVFAGKR